MQDTLIADAPRLSSPEERSKEMLKVADEEGLSRVAATLVQDLFGKGMDDLDHRQIDKVDSFVLEMALVRHFRREVH